MVPFGEIKTWFADGHRRERPEQIRQKRKWRGKQAHSVQDITEEGRLRNVGTVDVTHR